MKTQFQDKRNRLFLLFKEGREVFRNLGTKNEVLNENNQNNAT